MRLVICFAAMLVMLAGPAHAQGNAALPLFDAHLHYSHDAVEFLPPEQAVAILRKAGLRRALVSSSDDEGTQKLYRLAPDIVVPSLRPYRRRSDVGTWVRDDGILSYVEDRLGKHRYAALGEFHVYGADADLPVVRRIVQLGRQYGLVLHLHGDADAVSRVLRQDPGATILWAHSGFAAPAEVEALLQNHPRLFADLAYRSDHYSGGNVQADWLALFKRFPDRFMLGTDTFTPERWHFVEAHAAASRGWLASLPADLAEKIGWRNADQLFAKFLGQR